METVTYAKREKKKTKGQAKPTTQNGTKAETTMVGSSSEAKKSVSSSGCSPKAQGEASGSSASASSTIKLNPFAREWFPAKDRSPEVDRCLYLTFSIGHPLNVSEITWFFTQKFGRCVGRVYVFPPRRSDTPVCAKVVFKFSYIPAAVLRTKNLAHFLVNSKPMWCKRYEPRRNHQNQDNV